MGTDDKYINVCINHSAGLWLSGQ